MSKSKAVPRKIREGLYACDIEKCKFFINCVNPRCKKLDKELYIYIIDTDSAFPIADCMENKMIN